MKTLLFILTLLVVNLIHAAKPDSCCYKDSIELSRSFCMKAELKIIDNDYDSAAYYYAKSMEYVYLMPDDQANLIKILNHLEFNQIKLIVSMFYSYKSKFISPEDYVKTSIFTQKLDSAEKNIVLESLLGISDFRNSKYVDLSEIDSVLSKLEVTDQYWRLPDKELNRKTYEMQYKTDIENFNTILGLYEKFGSFNTNFLRNRSALYMILLHYFANYENLTKNLSFFENEVQLGNIHPVKFEMIVDNYLFDSTQVYGNHTVFIFNDTLIVLNISEKGVKKFNKNRSRIYLEDILTMQRKYIWQFKNFDNIILRPITTIIGYSSVNADEIARIYAAKMGDLVEGYTLISR